MVIAIDGYSSCGKSTLAKDIARELGITYVDSGAMYRAVTLYFINHDVSIENLDMVNIALSKIAIEFHAVDGSLHTYLNGHDVEQEIRSPKVASNVSEVAVLAPVRHRLVALQREMANKGSIIMDGRDIRSNVFPTAEFKFFITATPEIRAQRRLLELESKGITTNYQEVLANLKHRDQIDSTRTLHPLIKTDDAILVDNSNLSRQQQLKLVLDIIRNNHSVN